ncbi:phage tail assembly chaperone [Culicoidibacter larvae]|uniref:Phage portal protein n=1 Tax=Culicoidibacter larvae TaxID=2579976 RepID=A0A5R8Q8G1_9FIRM|nr:hypothetical protein [Culicoidibacter larvae]TLG71372.1 hypothetical protein FEZ08_10785 [Culicoidibacter larvae]
MGKFDAFINKVNKEQEFTFKSCPDAVFVVRELRPSELKRIRIAATPKGKKAADMDPIAFGIEALKVGLVSPDVNSAEFQDALEVTTAEDAIDKLLTANEFNTLVEAIVGMDENITELVDEAKN